MKKSILDYEEPDEDEKKVPKVSEAPCPRCGDPWWSCECGPVMVLDSSRGGSRK